MIVGSGVVPAMVFFFFFFFLASEGIKQKDRAAGVSRSG